jgi:IS5 family transposase
MLGLDLSAPDHTTLSRRAQRLNLTLRRVPTGTGIHLIVDSTELSLVGEGEWAAVKHGRRGTRGWKKIHLGVDGSGVIVAHALTGGHVDDATTALDLIHGRGQRLLPHGGRGLRHAWHLRGCGCAWRDGRHSTDQDGHRV